MAAQSIALSAAADSVAFGFPLLVSHIQRLNTLYYSMMLKLRVVRFLKSMDH